MKKYILVLFCLLLAYTSYAQQDYQYTQFMFNKMAFNPAYAGSKSVFCLSAVYRKQWIGIDRAPQTATLNAHGAVWKKRVGLGLTVSYDQIGFSDRVSIETNYSYIIRFKKESFLSIGLRGSAYYSQLKWEEADLIDNFDPTIPQTTSSKILPNFGAGVYFQAKNFYAGFSVPHLFKNQGDFNIAFNGTIEPEFTQHYYCMGGFIFSIAKNVQVQQNLLIKYVVNAPLSTDINVSFVFFYKVLFGITYRVGASIDAMLQWQITPQLRIAAAYDFSITDLQQYNSGSIEAMISYCFIKGKNGDGREVYNQRFF
jgi:type IX secretion system PorP/SprF family membrane protein